MSLWSVVVKMGYIKGTMYVFVGGWFPITAKKNLRAQRNRMENRLYI
jgi:hypothetical protein